MKTIKIWFTVFCLSVTIVKVNAQLCSNSTDSVYGLNSITGSGSGQIVSININDAGTSLVGSPATASVNANGMGFSQVNGRFYFFNQCGSGTTEFVSYDPLTGAKVTLANPPTFPTTQKVRSGTVTQGGSGYYFIFPGATTAMGYPVTNPAFYYYNIGANTWTLITQSFLDISGNNVTPIRTLNSGDIAFDGNDNLWILSSNAANYALYRINAPLPTTAVASVTVDTIIPQTPTPGGVSFTGIAFNSAGSLYLSTGSYTVAPGVAGNNQLYELPAIGSPFITIGTLPNGYGDDLTSCVYPIGVLPVVWVDFSATLNAGSAKLIWKVNEGENVDGYYVEFSKDGNSWQTIARIPKDNVIAAGLKTYYYSHEGYNEGANYYRIVQLSPQGRESISSTRTIITRAYNKIYIGPNPVKDVIYLHNKDNSTKLLARVFDKEGRLVFSTTVTPYQQSINIGHLSKGSFILKLSSPVTNEISDGYHFIKW